MAVSIEKELNKKVQKEIKMVEPLKEVKLLLEGDAAEDARILRGLSNNSQFNRMERAVGEQVELERLKADYDGKVFKLETIKKLAIDYHLRFLNSTHYSGAYDVEVAAKIKDFARVTNTQLTDAGLRNDFFVLGPEELFELRHEKYISKKNVDPVIFYKIDSTHYRLIHKWGKDFTFFRLLDGYRYKSWWHHQFFNTVMLLPISTLIFSLIFNVVNHPVVLIPTVLTSFLAAYITWGYSKHNESKQIDGYFSTENWNSPNKTTR
jgi:hypothetical protein